MAWEDAIVAVAKVLLLLLLPSLTPSLQVLDSTPPEQMAAVAGGMADGEVTPASDCTGDPPVPSH